MDFERPKETRRTPRIAAGLGSGPTIDDGTCGIDFGPTGLSYTHWFQGPKGLKQPQSVRHGLTSKEGYFVHLSEESRSFHSFKASGPFFGVKYVTGGWLFQKQDRSD